MRSIPVLHPVMAMGGDSYSYACMYFCSTIPEKKLLQSVNLS